MLLITTMCVVVVRTRYFSILCCLLAVVSDMSSAGAAGSGGGGSGGSVKHMDYNEDEVFDASPEIYTDQFVVKVRGGPELAKELARRHGFTFVSKVS